MTAVALIGISHKSTPASDRERFHLTPEDAAAVSRSLADGRSESVVLATCNRTEIYVAARDIVCALERARRTLVDLGDGTLPATAIYAFGGQQAAAHLFRVAAGLESVVLGDTHVAAQVRRAHHLARLAGSTGALLDRLFEAASAASKRVRSQTSLSRGPTSIPAAAIAAACRVSSPLADRRLLIVGAGRVARVAALNAARRGCCDIVIANRTLARGQALAAQVSGRAVALDELEPELLAADIVVSATGARGFILTAKHTQVIREHRARRQLVIFDLALPRDVDPEFRRLPATRLCALDDLAPMAANSGPQRRADLTHAGAIAAEEATRYEGWRCARAAAPVIAALHDNAEQTRRQVLARHASQLARLTPAEQGLVETVSAQLVAALLHGPTLALRRQTQERAA